MLLITIHMHYSHIHNIISWNTEDSNELTILKFDGRFKWY